MTTTQQPNTSDEKRQLQVTASDLAALLTDAIGHPVLAWWENNIRDKIDTEEDLMHEARDSAERWLDHQPHLHAEDGIPATMHLHDEHGTEDVRLVTDRDELREVLREWATTAAETQLRQALDVPDEEA
jgi:hypothetical protein